jgi:hypothetical protein
MKVTDHNITLDHTRLAGSCLLDLPEGDINTFLPGQDAGGLA